MKRKPLVLLLICLGLPALETPSGVVALIAPEGSSTAMPGSAVVISADGTALTLAEALPEGASKGLNIAIGGGRRRKARILRQDPATTAVVIQIDDLPADVRPLISADSRQLRLLDPVWTVGNSCGAIELDGAAALSRGVVSGLYAIPAQTAPVRGRGGQELSSYRGAAIETDAAINDGNQGGALLDDAGRLLGLASRGQTRDRRLPVAVPISRIIDALGLEPALTAPSGGGEAWRTAADRAAPSIALIYLERLNGPGNPSGVPRPTRAIDDVPLGDREKLRQWWDLYWHQQQVIFTDQPVSALAVGDDLLLTAASNLHGEAEHGRVLLATGPIACSVVARHLPLDLALLRCERPHGLPVATLATACPALGTPVALLGRLRDQSLTATLGGISATARRRTHSRLSFIQTDARANYGSMGGPLIDGSGQVVGLCVMLGPWDDRPWLINSGVALAVDAAQIAAVLPGLREGRTTETPPIIGLGVVLRIRNDQLVIGSVVAKTGAAEAGLQAGDELLRVDGQRTGSPEAVSRVLMRHQAGARVPVEVRREGAVLTVTVELREFEP